MVRVIGQMVHHWGTSEERALFYTLLDLVICPNCRRPLTLLALEERPERTAMRMYGALRTNPAGVVAGPLPVEPADTQLRQLLASAAGLPARDGREREVSVVQGVLVCVYCEHWYPIRDTLPELLPDHLRRWDEDRAWLAAHQANLATAGLSAVWELLQTHIVPTGQSIEDEGAHYKKAEMAAKQRNLPEGFFGPAAVAPFFPSRPSFSLDLVLRYGTTVARLDCGISGLVLDLGVGYAWTTEWLVRLGYQAIGVDICRDYILAGLPRMGSYLPHLLIADIENLPLTDNCLDAVLSFDAFHHLPNRSQAMMELSRAMRPGAKIALVEPGKAHETNPRSIAVMQQHGILERGFDNSDLARYIRGTLLGQIVRYRTNAHPHDIYTVQKAGSFESDSRTPRALLSDLVVQPESACVTVGTATEVVVSIGNLGDTTWLNSTPDGHGEVYLGASLFDNTHALLKEDYARVVLPHAVRPGESIRLRFCLPAIQRPGDYVVEFDMVDHGFFRFKDYNFQPLTWPLKVLGDSIEKESDGSLVSSENSLHLVAIELPVPPNSTKVNLLDSLRRPSPLVKQARRALSIAKLYGPLVLGRMIVGYLYRRLFTN